MLEPWIRTDIGMGRKDSILYSTLLDVNWYYPWIQCGIMMTISFTYGTSLSVCSWTHADMIFYKWLCKIITQSSLIAKITWSHKVSDFSAIANLAPVWTVSWVGWLFCVLVCWHKNKGKFYKYIFLPQDNMSVRKPRYPDIHPFWARKIWRSVN